MSRFVSGLQAFVDELRRRHVFRVATAYAVAAFVVLEAANLVFEGLLVPAWVYRTVTVLALAGFPVVLVLAWLFEWTRQGIRREPIAAGSDALAPSGRSAAPADDRPRVVRAYAFVGLGIVIAIVGMGLSLPYVYSQGDDAPASGSTAGTDGVVPVSSDGASDATIAVLPFVSLTGADDAGFADGLAEDVTAALAQLNSVEVVSRTTSEAYRDSELTARAIGRELGVGLILEGTIRRAGDRVRVTAQLIDARTDRHLWANTYDRELSGDVFRTQSQLAQEIVAAIRSVVRPDQQDQAERRLLALDMAAEGSELLERADPAYDAAAAQLFDEALEADPDVAEAHAGLAQTLASRAPTGPPLLLDSAAAHAEYAIRLNPELPAAWIARAFVLIARGQEDSARADLAHAMHLADSTQGFSSRWQARFRQLAPEAFIVVEPEPEPEPES